LAIVLTTHHETFIELDLIESFVPHHGITLALISRLITNFANFQKDEFNLSESKVLKNPNIISANFFL